MKKLIIKYSIEFFVIVFSISASFFVENIREEKAKINREKLVRLNLLNEMLESKSYLDSRLDAFNIDRDFLTALIDKKVSLDSLYKIGERGVGYYNSICVFRTFDPPNIIYSSLVSDGEINLIKEKELKNLLYRMNVLSPHYMKLQIDEDKKAANDIELHLAQNHPELYNKNLQVNNNMLLLKELRSVVFDDKVLLALINRKHSRMGGKNKVFSNYLKLRDSLINKLYRKND